MVVFSRRRKQCEIQQEYSITELCLLIRACCGNVESGGKREDDLLTVIAFIFAKIEFF